MKAKRWVYFVSYTGMTLPGRVTGMSEIHSDGPVERWSDIAGIVTAIRERNPGLDKVNITSYQLMRTESVA